MAFLETDGDRVLCSLCRAEYGHTTTCPVIALSGHLDDLASHVGLFVANMRESLDAIAQLLRDDRER